MHLDLAAHVGDQIFRELICGFLQDRTRVLVTHQVAMVIPEATLVVCLDGLGGVAACCAPAELSSELSGFMGEKSSKLGIDSSNASFGFLEMLSNLSTDSQLGRDYVTTPRTPPAAASSALSLQLPGDGSATSEEADEKKAKTAKNATPEGVVLLVEKEGKNTGSVGFDVYWFYLKSCGGVMSAVLLIGCMLALPMSWFVQSYALGQWMRALEFGRSRRVVWGTLAGYLLSVVLVVVVTTFQAVYGAISTFRGSKELHDNMLQKIVYATLSWHDSQPTGRKTNRFSQDISTVDKNVMSNFGGFMHCLIGTVQVFFVIAFTIPLLIPFFIPLIVYNYFVSGMYIRVSRELKRLESVNKSPVFVLFSESLAGISVIRAFGHEKRFFSICCNYVDTMNR